MTVNLEVLVRFVEELSMLRAPIVFKGAVVLKTAVANLGLGTDRSTQDVDGDWVGAPPTMQQLEALVQSAALRVDSSLVVKTKRAYGEGRSAGFVVLGVDGKQYFSVDISVKQNQFYQGYFTMHGMHFVGASPQKMFADKVAAVSSNRIFRRIKDVYDLYLLSSIAGYTVADTYNVYRVTHRQLEGFNAFKTRINEQRHAYGKLTGVTNKPDYIVVYNRVYHFIEPFIVGCQTNMIWNGTDWVVER